MREKWHCETCRKYHALKTWILKHGIEMPWLMLKPTDFSLDEPYQSNLFFELEGDGDAEEKTPGS